MAAKTKENFINDCCGGFSEIELNIVNNTWRAAIESVAVHSTSDNKQMVQLPDYNEVLKEVCSHSPTNTVSPEESKVCDLVYKIMSRQQNH